MRFVFVRLRPCVPRKTSSKTRTCVKRFYTEAGSFLPPVFCFIFYPWRRRISVKFCRRRRCRRLLLAFSGVPYLPRRFRSGRRGITGCSGTGEEIFQDRAINSFTQGRKGKEESRGLGGGGEERRRLCVFQQVRVPYRWRRV